MQRAALSYVITSEYSDKRDADFESFKQRMLAAHPEASDDIIEMFDRIEQGDFAEPLEDHDLADARPMDAMGLEEALEQMKTLGLGMIGG